MTVFSYHWIPNDKKIKTWETEKEKRTYEEKHSSNNSCFKKLQCRIAPLITPAHLLFNDLIKWKYIVFPDGLACRLPDKKIEFNEMITANCIMVKDSRPRINAKAQQKRLY